MKKKFRLGVIGAGFMSTAIIKGLISSNTLSAEEICVSDNNQQAIDKIASFGVRGVIDNTFVADNSDFVLFAVKPQNFDEVLSSISNSSANKFISIMAGVKKQKIKVAFPNSMVARCMPNTPCSIGAGAIGLDISDYNEIEDKDFICGLFSVLGQVVLVSEDKLNAVTGVSGSSPAYFYTFIKGIIEGGQRNGLTEEQAKILAVNTMIGTGKMILQNSDKSIDELIQAVCSKGGTTIEAVKVFNENDLTEITCKAIDACVKRSFELENL